MATCERREIITEINMEPVAKLEINFINPLPVSFDEAIGENKIKLHASETRKLANALLRQELAHVVHCGHAKHKDINWNKQMQRTATAATHGEC